MSHRIGCETSFMRGSERSVSEMMCTTLDGHKTITDFPFFNTLTMSMPTSETYIILNRTNFSNCNNGIFAIVKSLVTQNYASHNNDNIRIIPLQNKYSPISLMLTQPSYNYEV